MSEDGIRVTRSRQRLNSCDVEDSPKPTNKSKVTKVSTLNSIAEKDQEAGTHDKSIRKNDLNDSKVATPQKKSNLSEENVAIFNSAGVAARRSTRRTSVSTIDSATVPPSVIPTTPVRRSSRRLSTDSENLKPTSATTTSVTTSVRKRMSIAPTEVTLIEESENEEEKSKILNSSTGSIDDPDELSLRNRSISKSPIVVLKPIKSKTPNSTEETSDYSLGINKRRSIRSTPPENETVTLDASVVSPNDGQINLDSSGTQTPNNKNSHSDSKDASEISKSTKKLSQLAQFMEDENNLVVLSSGDEEEFISDEIVLDFDKKHSADSPKQTSAKANNSSEQLTSLSNDESKRRSMTKSPGAKEVHSVNESPRVHILAMSNERVRKLSISNSPQLILNKLEEIEKRESIKSNSLLTDKSFDGESDIAPIPDLELTSDNSSPQKPFAETPELATSQESPADKKSIESPATNELSLEKDSPPPNKTKVNESPATKRSSLTIDSRTPKKQELSNESLAAKKPILNELSPAKRLSLTNESTTPKKLANDSMSNSLNSSKISQSENKQESFKNQSNSSFLDCSFDDSSTQSTAAEYHDSKESSKNVSIEDNTKSENLDRSAFPDPANCSSDKSFEENNYSFESTMEKFKAQTKRTSINKSSSSVVHEKDVENDEEHDNVDDDVEMDDDEENDNVDDVDMDDDEDDDVDKDDDANEDDEICESPIKETAKESRLNTSSKSPKRKSINKSPDIFAEETKISSFESEQNECDKTEATSNDSVINSSDEDLDTNEVPTLNRSSNNVHNSSVRSKRMSLNKSHNDEVQSAKKTKSDKKINTTTQQEGKPVDEILAYCNNLLLKEKQLKQANKLGNMLTEDKVERLQQKKEKKLKEKARRKELEQLLKAQLMQKKIEKINKIKEQALAKQHAAEESSESAESEPINKKEAVLHATKQSLDILQKTSILKKKISKAKMSESTPPPPPPEQALSSAFETYNNSKKDQLNKYAGKPIKENVKDDKFKKKTDLPVQQQDREKTQSFKLNEDKNLQLKRKIDLPAKEVRDKKKKLNIINKIPTISETRELEASTSKIGAAKSQTKTEMLEALKKSKPYGISIHSKTISRVNDKKKKISSKNTKIIVEEAGLLKPVWTSAGEFIVTKIPLQSTNKRDVVETATSKFSVISRNKQAKNVEATNFSGLHFKENAMFKKKQIPRETSKQLINRKQKQTILRK